MPDNLALLTDLYQLTMAAGYFEHKMFTPATFSLFIRNYPPHRSYFVSAGLMDVMESLENFHFTAEDMAYLDSTGLFRVEFLNYLESLRFSGDLFAIPEGRLFFRDEPILELTAPIIEAQLMETFIINAVNLQVTIATKASRCVHAAKGRKLVDFSLRRTNGRDASIKVARASYIAGFIGTSNLLAGKLYNIPVFGTMAHSFILSFEDELEAFRAFARAFPENTVLLIDTYDTVKGAEKAVVVGKEMGARGAKLKGVRLDSGDIADLSVKVRRILSEAGLGDASIFASGGLDEYGIAHIIEAGGEVDAFGIGTKMGVSADAPYTDMAYKLVSYGGKPVLKLSSEKETLVCDKQVLRTVSGGRIKGDAIALRSETVHGEPLLKPVMKKGKRLEDPEPLTLIRDRFREEFALLGDERKALETPEPYPVRLTDKLMRLQEKTVHRVRVKELGES
jgi:nicotinate phosphoribosyltransferase